MGSLFFKQTQRKVYKRKEVAPLDEFPKDYVPTTEAEKAAYSQFLRKRPIEPRKANMHELAARNEVMTEYSESSQPIQLQVGNTAKPK